jgi:hypothetical protein
MPQSHRRHSEWSPGRLLGWAQKIGPGARAEVQGLLESRPHPEQGDRSCLSLVKTYDEQRLEAACRRGLSSMSLPTRKHVLAILKANLEQHPDLFPGRTHPLQPHRTRTRTCVGRSNSVPPPPRPPVAPRCTAPRRSHRRLPKE